MASASDNFDRADNTSLGANWAEDAGDYQISSNRAVQRTTSNGYYKARYTATAPATGDYYSQSVVRSPTGAGQGTGVAVRMVNSATVTYYGYVYFGGDAAYLVEITGGVESILDTGDAVTGGTDYTAKLEANGSALTGTRNGSADVSATDSTLTGGGWGLAAFAGVGSGITQSWDDWTAADLAAPATETGFMTTTTGYWGP